jgi:hypothetical protein
LGGGRHDRVAGIENVAAMRFECQLEFDQQTTCVLVFEKARDSIARNEGWRAKRARASASRYHKAVLCITQAFKE